MNTKSDKVIESYHRCRSQPVFFDAFYDFFMSKSAEVTAKFAHTNFDIQKRFLRDSLLTLLRYSLGNEGVRGEIEQLGRRHSRGQLDIRPEFYELWLDALCQCVALYDPEYQPSLEKKWRSAMQQGIDLMISKYEP